MTNLSSRQQEIVSLVNQKGALSVEEIRQLTEASQATVYREIQDLTRRGLVLKIPGGIGRVEVSLSHCFQCGHENNPRTTFFIEQKDGKRLAACCSHCGLLALSKLENISLATTTDFLYGTLLNVSLAWYVLDSQVSLCCRPSILSFSEIEAAKRFVLGFGGSVVGFLEAQNSLAKMMSLSNFHTL